MSPHPRKVVPQPITCVARWRHRQRTRMNEQRWWAAAQPDSQPARAVSRTLRCCEADSCHTTDWSSFCFFSRLIWLSDWSLDRWSIHLNSRPSVCGASMARGEGAEQCASTFLAAKQLNAGITPKVRNSHLVQTAVSVRAPNWLAAASPHLEVWRRAFPLSSAHAPPEASLVVWISAASAVCCRDEPNARKRARSIYQ